MNHFHAVRFYDSSESIARVVAAFLGAGFIVDEPGLVIATREHQSAIMSALRTVTFSLESLQASGKLVLLEPGPLLAAFIADGAANPARFEAVIDATLERAATPATRRVRAYDEMVDLLWKQDQPTAAMDLESLWDRITVGGRCSLLCGHDTGPASQPAARQWLCARHTHVLAEDGIPHPVTAA